MSHCSHEMDVRTAESDVVVGVLHCSGAHHRYSATQRSSVISRKKALHVLMRFTPERERVPKLLVPRSNGPLPSDLISNPLSPLYQRAVSSVNLDTLQFPTRL